MDIPKHGIVVNIYADGRVAEHFDEFQETIGTAVPVPPHGKLIDADELKKKHHWTDDFYETEYVEVEDIDTAHTIIPAEEG